MKTLEEMIAVMTAAKNGAVIETCQLNIYKKPMYPYYTECDEEQLVWDWGHWDYRVKEAQEEKAYKIYRKAANLKGVAIISNHTKKGFRAVIDAVKAGEIT